MPERVYVASPLGFAMPTRIFYTRTLLPALEANGALPVDPWSPEPEDLTRALALPLGPARISALRRANERIGARNAQLIKSSRAVFAVLDGPDVDSGTAAEIGYAAALGKPVIGWRSDLRRTGDNDGTLVNLQVEHFAREGGGSVHADLNDALTALRALLLPRVR